MLICFPEPYPDELLYSVFARYHYLVCNQSLKDTTNELLGVKTACAVVDLPSHLQYLCDKLPQGSLYTPEKIIGENTLFPLFQPFLPPKSAQLLTSKMKSQNQGGNIHNSIGIMASGVPALRHLQYCPKCYEEDENLFGEPYWHRTHQVSGVLICPRHQTWLEETNIVVSSPRNKHAFYLLKQPIKTTPLERLNSGGYSSHYLRIAELIEWLLNHPINSLGLTEVRNRYLFYLQKYDLVSYNRRIRQQEFIKEFTNFYGEAFLESLNCCVDNSMDNWLSRLVRKPRNTCHPLRHILLMVFLGITPEQFFTGKFENNHPFGCGPWPCLNPVSGHYRKSVIRKIRITNDSKLKRPVGHFTCSCGFSYSRRGPDQNDSDRYTIGRIHSFGLVWKKELIHLVTTENISLRELAHRFNVDSKTIKKQLSQITINRADINSPNKKLSDPPPYRKQWLNVVKQNPHRSRTELRKLAYAIYAWLYRNDREWLTTNLPEPIKREKCEVKRVNWIERDQYLAQQVSRAVNKIKASEQLGETRLSISSIGKEIGELMILQKHLDKLPITRDVLKNVVESKEQYRIRRAKAAINQIVERGDSLQPWKIAREAGIRPEFMEPIIQAFDLNTIFYEEGDYAELFI